MSEPALDEVPLLEGGQPDQERMVPETYKGMLVEAEHVARYAWAAQAAAGKVVLDAACGVGYGTEMLARAGARSAVGVDLSAQAIEAAERAYGSLVQFTTDDILDLDLADDSFELIVCFEAIEHVAEPAAAVVELKRVLAPDGVLLISTPNKRIHPDAVNPYHLAEMTPEEFAELLGGHFANVRLHHQQDYVASVITDEAGWGADDAGTPLADDARRMAPDPRGESSFAVAVAGDGELPELGGLAMLTDFRSIRQWYVPLVHWVARAQLAEAQMATSQMRFRRLEANHERLKRRLEAYQRSLPLRAWLALRRRTRRPRVP